MWSDAPTKIPWAAPVVPSHEHETRSWRALVPQARSNLAGHARRHEVVFDRGCLAGVAVWWLAPPGIVLVVPATEHMAVTVDAQAHAAAGEGVTGGRRAHTVRQGQGRTAASERLETEVVGLTGRTTDDQDGTPAHGRPHHRRAFQPNAITAVVVRPGNPREDGPGGQPVFRTNASGEKPWPPFDDDDERRLIEHGCIKESKQPWSVQPPPQKTARAVRVHVMFTLRMFALATASRLPCAPEEVGAEPSGWQRWRRQLLEQTRDQVLVWAQGPYGIFQMAEYSKLLGAKLKAVPPGIGTLRAVLAR